MSLAAFSPAPADSAAVRAAVLARSGREISRSEIRFACPSHDDAHPSARFNQESAVWRCDACGAHGGFLDLAERLGVELESRGRTERRIVATYGYTDEQGQPLYQVVRYEPKDFRQRRSDGNGGWQWGLGDTRRVLYRLPEVRAVAEAGWRAYVTEGERDADAIAELGLCGTTSPHGAGKWRPEYAESLRGAEVVVVADKDAPGRAHAQTVARSCLGKARIVRVLELPGDAVKDAADFLSAGGTKADLERLADEAPEWTPERKADAKAEPSSVVSQMRALTDLGNAARLVDRHGSDLRYCAALDAWHVWDGVRWARDDTGEITRRASESVLALYADAEQLEDRTRRAELVKHAVRSEADARIAAAIHLAPADARVAIRPDVFDADPWVLNVVNGTIDLRSGGLRAHRREDLITKLSPVAYHPDARLELWDTFLFTAAGGDAQLLRYLQRVAGYSMTGDTREEILLFLHGPTAAGKSTLVEAVKSAAGDYAVTADFDTFLSRRDSGPRNDIARLAGRRLVVSIEMEEGRRLAGGS